MPNMSLILRTLGALLLSLGLAGVAQAQTCGIRGSATAAPATYDPFNPAGLPTTTVVLNLTRQNTSGGGDTRIVNFYLKGTNAGADGTTIVPIAVAGSVSSLGIGNNIFSHFGATPPTVSPTTLVPTATQRFLQINFTCNNAGSDTAQVTFQITLPSNLDVNATSNLAVDAYCGCNIHGGKDNGLQQQGSFTNAVVFPITVLSALQASYAGTALDFGEVGDKTTVDVLAAPATYTTPATNHVRVRSSGPYTVALTSQNTYKLTFPGGNLATPTHVLNYDLKFLGQTRNAASPTFATVTCQRAGVPASEADMLPVVATLKEGGQGKLVSPTYLDTLTVTITPLLSGAPSQQNCPAL